MPVTLLADPAALPAALAHLQTVAARWRTDYEDRRHNGEPSAAQIHAETAAFAAGATEAQVAAAWDRGIHWGAANLKEIPA